MLNGVKSLDDLLDCVTNNRAFAQKTLAEFPHFDIVRAAKFRAAKSDDVVCVEHTLYFQQKDDKWYNHEDSFIVSPEIFPAHIRDKILGFDGKVDITEEIDNELAARTKSVAAE